MSRLSFILHIDPPTATHQQKQVRVVRGKPLFYEPRNVQEARALFHAHLSHHVPESPLEGPVRLSVTYFFGTQDKERDGKLKTTRPDLDNSQKLLQDAMTQLGFWKDDSQIASLSLVKFWGAMPCIAISLEEME